ncbi:hypothetical protein D3C78_907320 [compost metagenome]
MLIQGNQRAQRCRVQLLQQQEAAGAVARAVLFAALVLAPHHQGLGLGHGVDQQAVVVRPQVFAAAAQGDEFDGNHILALVQHLEERVLAVGARLAPDNG